MAVEGLSARLYFDHNVHRRLARDLRDRGFDLVTAPEAGNEDATDEEHLTWSTGEGRVLVTYDRRDFRVIARAWAREGRDHAGIIISVAPPRLPYAQVLRRLLALLDAFAADEFVNQVLWLGEAWLACDETG